MITSLVNSLNPVVDASRDDLQPGDVVTVTYNGIGAVSYSWSLSYIPVDANGTSSTATLVSSTLPSTTFTVDLPGSYLVKFVIDATLITEAEEYVRLRYIPSSGLRLVAAGERNDLLGTIPVDASPSGWSNDLNRSLLILSESITQLLGQQNTTTTSDATPTFIDLLSLLPNTSAKQLQITVTSTSAATSEYGILVFSLMIYSDATDMYIGPAGIQNDFTDVPGAWSVSIAPNLLDLEITVTGELGKTINWVSVMKVTP